ncbi:MAG: helix-turn-helix transcriptional regulator, partial [Candidatus Thorarchaeota archaeon]|nr:helix-turn-helix transcriptional regulator [Candidatus Thorarchaeota archaeon]
MTQEHVERLENLERYCKTVPDKAPCCEPYDQRKATIDGFRESFETVGPEIFTATIRTGIVMLLLKVEDACVCEFQYALNEPRQPLMSHHLRKMKQAGWLKSERKGR